LAYSLSSRSFREDFFLSLLLLLLLVVLVVLSLGFLSRLLERRRDFSRLRDRLLSRLRDRSRRLLLFEGK
jgi:hypothetical protein